MTKTESQILKGVAILLMLYWHLFNRLNNVELCSTKFSVGGMPLVHWLSLGTNPVTLFLILSGYGMHKVNEKGDIHRWTRILRLLLHYWIILSVFLFIGHCIYPDRYSLNIWLIVENYSTINTTYNGECWFLFPYILLSISAPFLFRVLRKRSVWTILSISYIISVITSYLISRHWKDLFEGHFLFYDFFLYFHLLFSFLLGAMSAREKWFDRNSYIDGNHWNWFLIIIIFLLRCFFHVSVLSSLYAFAFVFLFVKAPRFLCVDSVLASLGKYSMDMWFIHSWFCYYLFKDFIYGFSYPILIFAVLVILSYICSRLLNFFLSGFRRLFDSL